MMPKRLNTVLIIFYGFCMLFPWQVEAQSSWQEINTVEEVVETYPDRMREMLEAFDLDYPGLEGVKQAYAHDSIAKACHLLLDYYKNGTTAQYLRKEQPALTNKKDALADTILTNVFVIQNVRGEVPYGDDGHRDWYYKGPNNDREWAWLSNRHSQINYVLSVYFKTGNPKYAEYIDLFLRDFIIKSMPYPGVKSSTSVWRGLEVAARAKVWSRIFYALQSSDYLSPATRLLMLSSLPDHAHYNRNFHGSNNWLTMEISALATVATNFPEYKGSNEWLTYSIETMTESMRGQVYADGAQTELTTHYHQVALSNFYLFYTICSRANVVLPDYFTSQIEDMWNYLAMVMRPDGHALLNNDGDLDYNKDKIIAVAKEYGRNDWMYVATNGKEGTRPENGPSNIFPWAGHLISRSGYDADAQWSFFDIGPWGSGHQHNDKMHISVSTYGKDFLVDAGRFAYTGEVAKKFRGYARGSQGHNVVLIDGAGQDAGPKLAEVPLDQSNYKITEDFDFARGDFGNFKGIEGDAEHSRSLFYVRNHFWIVVDKVKTDRPRKIETLWHWHPECDVTLKKGQISMAKNDRGNLQIIPVGKTKWDVRNVKGQEIPEIQGWYSREYNDYEPNDVSIYSTDIKSTGTFVWVLAPSEKAPKPMKVKILSENEDLVRVKVTNHKKRSWIVNVPHVDSSKAILQTK